MFSDLANALVVFASVAALAGSYLYVRDAKGTVMCDWMGSFSPGTPRRGDSQSESPQREESQEASQDSPGGD